MKRVIHNHALISLCDHVLRVVLKYKKKSRVFAIGQEVVKTRSRKLQVALKRRMRSMEFYTG